MSNVQTVLRAANFTVHTLLWWRATAADGSSSGLILSTAVGLSKKSLDDKFDFLFVALTVITVNRLHQSVPRTLLVVDLLAVLIAFVSIGLLLAGCFTMAKGAISGTETAAIAVGVLLILLQYKVNPALLVMGGAVIGVLSFMPK
jgi:chromate transport protein ChrA